MGFKLLTLPSVCASTKCFINSFWVSHLVLGQEFASPVSMRDVVDGEAEIVVTVFEEQWLGILEQNPAQTPLKIQHLLHTDRQKEDNGFVDFIMDLSFSNAQKRFYLNGLCGL